MSNEEIPRELTEKVTELYNSLGNILSLPQDKRPQFLAHYTTLDTLEKIIKNNEIWFSNPLFMNDLQELRWGFQQAHKAFFDVAEEADVKALVGSDARMSLINSAFYGYFKQFDQQYAFDVYVFCLSEHDPEKHPDGLLSMWRGYGANGHGAALVFKTDFIAEMKDSPLLIAKVNYATDAVRSDWMKTTIRRCFELLRDYEMQDDKLYLVGYHMYYLTLMYSLTSKNSGFIEEQEWRVVYMPDRDGKELFKDQFHYAIGQNSIEPKLRFPLEPLKLEPRQSWTFESILESIILGPTHQSPLAELAVKRMLDTLKRPELKPKLKFSNIPLRPTR